MKSIHYRLFSLSLVVAFVATLSLAPLAAQELAAQEPEAENNTPAEATESGDTPEEPDHEDTHAKTDGDAKADPEHGDEAHGETGLPLTFKSDLALWSLITFVVFILVMKKMAWGPLIAGLDQRESGIRSAIADAEENQRKSQAMLAEYEDKLRSAEQTVADMVAEAQRDAERTSQDIVAKAQADVESMRDRARDEISRAKDQALAEVFGSVNAQVASATEHVLGRALSDADQDRLIGEALAEISA